MNKKLAILYLELIKRVYPNGKKIRIQHSTKHDIYFWFDKHTDNGFILGFYEENLVQTLLKYIKGGSVFYDLGAHWGYFSLLAADAAGESGAVYAFEPMPINFQRLQKNICLNKIKCLEAFNLAVSDRETKLKFSDTEDSYANTYINNQSESSSIEVAATSIDSFIIKNEARPPDFIKIDVEGAEFDVLKGASKAIERHRPVIHLSTHEKHVKGVDSQCCSWMIEMGYAMNKISADSGISDYICVSQR